MTRSIRICLLLAPVLAASPAWSSTLSRNIKAPQTAKTSPRRYLESWPDSSGVANSPLFRPLRWVPASSLAMSPRAIVTSGPKSASPRNQRTGWRSPLRSPPALPSDHLFVVPDVVLSHAADPHAKPAPIGRTGRASQTHLTSTNSFFLVAQLQFAFCHVRERHYGRHSLLAQANLPDRGRHPRRTAGWQPKQGKPDGDVRRGPGDRPTRLGSVLSRGLQAGAANPFEDRLVLRARFVAGPARAAVMRSGVIGNIAC